MKNKILTLKTKIVQAIKRILKRLRENYFFRNIFDSKLKKLFVLFLLGLLGGGLAFAVFGNKGEKNISPKKGELLSEQAVSLEDEERPEKKSFISKLFDQGSDSENTEKKEEEISSPEVGDGGDTDNSQEQVGGDSNNQSENLSPTPTSSPTPTIPSGVLPTSTNAPTAIPTNIIYPTNTPILESATPTPTTTQIERETKDYNLSPQGSCTPGAFGSVSITAIKYEHGYWDFDISGSFNSLNSGQSYQVWLCNIDCSSYSGAKFSTDGLGNGSIETTINHAQINDPVSSIRIYQISGGCQMESNDSTPCLQAGISF